MYASKIQTSTMMFCRHRTAPILLLLSLSWWLKYCKAGFCLNGGRVCGKNKCSFRFRHPQSTRTTSCPILLSEIVMNAATTEKGEVESSTMPDNSFVSIDDIIRLARHLVACVLCSLMICSYQDFDVSRIKPWGPLRPQSLYGMGYGKEDRLLLEDSATLKGVPSYNEVMKYHRQERVPYWKRNNFQQHDVDHAVQSLYVALDAIDRLKNLAKDYQWEEMRTIIRQPALTIDLERGCSILQSSSASRLSQEERAEIGFAWGSCAWRHCGALADAQEALAELYNLIGVLEPFECRFCLDVIERSLRDILAVLPQEYQRYDHIYRPYKAYEPLRQTSVLDIEGENEQEDSSSFDMDYVDAMAQLRNSFL